MTVEKEKINKAGIFRNGSKRRDLLFVLLLLVWPTLQFAVFYIGVNFNSFLMMFQSQTRVGTEIVVDTDFKYFVQNWDWLKTSVFNTSLLPTMIKTSLLSWAVSICIGSPLGLLFSYYISKKFRGSQFFRVILYLPSIISAFVLIIMYKFFLNYPVAKSLGVFGSLTGTSPLTTRLALIFGFNIWVGFGTSVLMYSNAMSGIEPEIFESAAIDGASGLKEFFHISFPMIWSTYSVFFVNSIANIFVNQINLYSMYGPDANPDMYTFGYYMFKTVSSSRTLYPQMALLGIMLSLVAIPLTFIVRKLMEKYGPSTK